MFEFRHFLPHSSSTKMFEIINFKWLNKKLLELIFIVSSDCRADIFASSFAAVNSAEFLFSPEPETFVQETEVAICDNRGALELWSTNSHALPEV